MRKIADWVKENNSIFISRYIMSVISLLCACFLYVILFSDEGIKQTIASGIVIVLSGLSCSRYFCKEYLNIQQSVGSEDISEIMRYHSFDIDMYFQIIRNNMKKHIYLMGSCAAVMAIMVTFLTQGKEFEWWRLFTTILIGIILMLTPSISLAVQKKIFTYKMIKGSDGKLKILLKVLSGIVLIIEILFCLLSVVFTVLIGWSVFGALVSPKILETSIVFRSHVDMQSIFVLEISILGVLFLVANYGYKYFSKRLFQIAFAIAVCFIIAGVFLTVYEQNVYTEFADDKIIIYNFGVKAEYDTEDIVAFYVDADEETNSKQLKLTFNDGMSVDITGGIVTNNDLFTNTYEDVNDYIEDYIEALETLGIGGQYNECLFRILES